MFIIIAKRLNFLKGSLSHSPSQANGYWQLLQQSSKEISSTNKMIIGVNGFVASRLIIAENMIVAISQTLASAEFYINVTNNVLVTVS